MKAYEARRTAKKAVQSEIDEINKNIEIEAEKGRTALSIASVSQGALAFLKDEGYDVQIYSGTGFSTATISW
jgi:hypothetical protein